jgi:hypothetical protein
MPGHVPEFSFGASTRDATNLARNGCVILRFEILLRATAKLKK